MKVKLTLCEDGQGLLLAPFSSVVKSVVLTDQEGRVCAVSRGSVTPGALHCSATNHTQLPQLTADLSIMVPGKRIPASTEKVGVKENVIPKHCSTRY